jgi:archaellum component FlaC
MAKLGTLTVDLVARVGGFVQGLDKAERESKKRLRAIRKNFEVLGQAAGLGITSATAALTALTASTVSAARDLQRFAAISQSSTQEFQRFAAGAAKVGIEQEKLADIFKDVNDRVGDFLVTGAGPLADFFEQIAPKVGVTIDQFRNLSGPQALGLYVDSLQRANVSASEFTFFLEAVASDATALLPLLQNNGELLREFGDQAERTGKLLDDELIESSLKLAEQQERLQASLKGIANDVAGSFIPAVAGIVETFEQARLEGNRFAGSGDIIRGTLIKISQGAVLAAGAFDILGKGLGTSVAAFAALGRQNDEGFFSTEGLKRAAEVLKVAGQDINETRQFYSQLLADIQSTGDINPLDGLDNGAATANERLKELQDRLRSIGSGSRNSDGFGAAEGKLQEISVTATKVKDTLTEWVEQQSAYQNLVGELRTDEERINDTLRKRLAIIDEADEKLFGSDKAEQRRRAAEAAFGSIEAPSFGGIDAVVGGAASELNRIDQAREALEEWYSEQLDRLAQFRQEQAGLNEIWNEREIELTREREKKIRQIEQARQLATLSAAESAFGDLADITRQFAGEQSDAYRVLFAIEKGAAIARSIIAIQTALAQAATAGPFPANLAAIASVASATAGIISTIGATTFQGQAHDGLMSVPKTGTYLLEKGERVTTADTSAKLDQKLDSMGSGGVRIINAIDPSLIGDYIGSTAGEKVIMNTIRRNQRTISALATA